jgi:hypothetical protein
MSEAYRHQVRSGGCQCGAIRFHATELRDNPHVCYCRMCQKAMGNLFAALVGVRRHHLTWTRGEPAEFMSSDLAARGYCRDCGTPLYYRAVGGEHLSMAIGAFDEPQTIPILYQFGIEGRHPALLHLAAIEEVGTTETNMPGEVGPIRDTNHQHPDHDTERWP